MHDRRTITATRVCAPLTAAVMSLLAACSSMDSVFSDPGKFAYSNCDQLLTQGRAAVARERELKTLMDKADTGAGGGLVNALAYNNEYRTVLSDLQRIEIVAAEKKCQKQFRSISDRSMW